MINPELIQLLQQWRDYHWQEAFAAHGPYTSLKHQSTAEGLDKALQILAGSPFLGQIPETDHEYKHLSYGQYPETR